MDFKALLFMWFVLGPIALLLTGGILFVMVMIVKAFC